MRKACFCLNPRVRFSVGLVGESGDGVYLSLISAKISSSALAEAIRIVRRQKVHAGPVKQVRMVVNTSH